MTPVKELRFHSLQEAVDIVQKSTPVPVLDAQAGYFWWDEAGLIPQSAKYVQLITWKDYFERTAL